MGAAKDGLSFARSGGWRERWCATLAAYALSSRWIEVQRATIHAHESRGHWYLDIGGAKAEHGSIPEEGREMKPD
jgi:hypothetical protein